MYSPPQRFPISLKGRNGGVQCVFIIARAVRTSAMDSMGDMYFFLFSNWEGN